MRTIERGYSSGDTNVFTTRRPMDDLVTTYCINEFTTETRMTRITFSTGLGALGGSRIMVSITPHMFLLSRPYRSMKKYVRRRFLNITFELEGLPR